MKSKRCLFVNGSMHGVLREVDVSDGYTDYIVPVMPDIPSTFLEPFAVDSPIKCGYESYEPHRLILHGKRHTFYILRYSFVSDHEKIPQIENAILKHWSDTFADAG